MAGDNHESESDARRKARRRKALDDVFGEALPDVTADEPAESARRRRGSGSTADERDDEIRRDIPPHHS
jgi:hypothetical protein